MKTSFRAFSFHIAMTAVLLASCSEKDTAAPPPPNIDLVDSPTMVANLWLMGSAEYGSTVHIVGGSNDLTVEADDFTARWRAEVTLDTVIPAGQSSVTTTFTLTAKDSAGNESSAVTIDVIYEPPHPEILVLELSKDQITTDEGEITATVSLANDRLFDLSGFDVTFTVTGAPGLVAPANTMVAQSNSAGVARATFTGLHTAASDVTVAATSFSLTDDRTFDVLPGRAASFETFALEGGASDGVIAAGDDVDYTYAVADQFGNATIGQVMVTVNDPDAVIFDDGMSGSGSIFGLTHAGSYLITARIGGAGTVETKDLTVTVAAGARTVDLTLTLSRMAVNDKVLAITIVRDLYGNVIASPAPTYNVTPQATLLGSYFNQNGNEFQITQAGVFQITATFDDGVNAPASASAYIIVEVLPDVLSPTAALSITFPQSPLVARNGRIEASIVFNDDRALGEGVLYAQFGSSVGCTAQSNTLVLSGLTIPNTTPIVTSVRVPGCAWPLDQVTVVAKVTDKAGNLGYSNPAALTVSAPPGFDVTATTEPSYTSTTAALNGSLGGNGSTDLTADAQSDILYVTEQGNGRVRVYFPDRTTSNLNDLGGNRYNFGAPTGITVVPTGDLLVGDTGDSAVYMITTDLPLRDVGTQRPPYTQVSGLNGPERLNYEGVATKPLMCVAQSTTATAVSCYKNATATTGGATLELTVTPPTGTPAQAADAWVATSASTSGTLWVLTGDCHVYAYTLNYSVNPVTATSPVYVTGAALTGGPCVDLVALPSGDAAVAKQGAGQGNGRIVRLTASVSATETLVAESFETIEGLDFARDTLYALDTGWQAIFAIKAAAGNPF